jgi:hypothetical protein
MPHAEAVLLARADLDACIDRDIRHRRGQQWSKLSQCFRWDALQRYMAERGVEQDGALHAEVRSLVRRKGGLPDLEYDSETQRVVRLNLGGI